MKLKKKSGRRKKAITKEAKPIGIVSTIREFIIKAKEFVNGPLWLLNLDELSGYRRFLIYQIRVCYIVAKGYMKGKLPIRAAYLTYISLLALIPLLAVIFSLFKAFGGMTGVQTKLEPFIMENIAGGSQQMVMDYIKGFVDNINAGTLGFVGGAALVITVISLMTNIEKSFNDIWGINKPRPFFIRFSTYITILALGPLLIGVSLSMTAALRSHSFTNYFVENYEYGGLVIGFMFKLFPIVFTWIAFTLMFAIMPNTKVSVKSAVIGGVISGTIWEIAKVFYSVYQVKSTNYSVIYGSLAALPFFLIWVYISWAIVLFGANIVFANENANSYEWEEGFGKLTFRFKQILGLWLMTHICYNFTKGLPPFSPQQIAEKGIVPLRMVNQVTNELVQQGLLIEVSGPKYGGGFMPAKPCEDILVSDVFEHLAAEGKQMPEFFPDSVARVSWQVLDNYKKAISDSNINLTMEVIINKVSEEPVGDITKKE